MPKPSAQYGSLPFQEQIDFFKGKVNLPTASWTDLWEGMHSKAFVVAGAMEESLLTDLKSAVEKAITEGTTLEQFRKDFDKIIARTGWAYNGGRNWRTQIIYDTNLRTSYSAGREAQMRDPELRKLRPYGLYKHNPNVAEPRHEHLAWDGLVLPLDDPWWDTHTPPNGWGCQCEKRMLSESDMKRLGLEQGSAPPLDMETVTVGQRGPSPRTVDVPKGIDPGFAYNPGKAAFGEHIPNYDDKKWKPFAPHLRDSLNIKSYGRPETIPAAKTNLKPLPPAKTKDELVTRIKAEIGGDSKVFNVGGLPININAESLAKHIEPDMAGRSPYINFLVASLEKPFEVWRQFERHEDSGQIRLRTRLISNYQLHKDKFIFIVADAQKGQFAGWTFIAISNKKYINSKRHGILVHGENDY